MPRPLFASVTHQPALAVSAMLWGHSQNCLTHPDGDSLPEMLASAFRIFLTLQGAVWPHAPWFGGWDAGVQSWTLLVVLFPQRPMAGLAAEIPTLWS